MKIKTLFSVSLFSLMLAACSEAPKDDFDKVTTVDTTGKINKATADLASQVIKSIPPPVELSSILKNSGAEYASDILNNTDNVSSYTTNYLKAANLGIYGADLGYINIYNHKEDALTYLNTVIDLANGLKVGQFFDFETIKRIANNNKNLDSMLNITQTNFEKMNTFLQDQQRSNISTYMLAGGWVEAMYITTSVALKKNDKALFEKIGEQKMVLDQLVILLDFFKNDPNAIEISKELAVLKTHFSEVKIETIYGEPTMVEENGMLVVKDNSKTNITITPETVAKIQKTVSELRKKITG
ncbi:MAG: hypothetical protein U0V72_04915 [Cytophagales bacterium]